MKISIIEALRNTKLVQLNYKQNKNSKFSQVENILLQFNYWSYISISPKSRERQKLIEKETGRKKPSGRTLYTEESQLAHLSLSPKRDWPTEATFLRSPLQTGARWRGEWNGGASCLIAQCWHKPSREWAPNLDVFQEGPFSRCHRGKSIKSYRGRVMNGRRGEGEQDLSLCRGNFAGRSIFDFSLNFVEILEYRARKFISLIFFSLSFDWKGKIFALLLFIEKWIYFDWKDQLISFIFWLS